MKTIFYLLPLAVLFFPNFGFAQTIVYEFVEGKELETTVSMISPNRQRIGTNFISSSTFETVTRIDLSVAPAFNPDSIITLAVYETATGTTPGQLIATSQTK